MSSLVDVSMVKWQLTNMMGEFADDIRNMYSASIANYNAGLKEGINLLSNDELPTFLYGVRGQAFTLYNLVPTITSVLGVSALPVLTSCFSKGAGDKKVVKRSIESTVKFTALISAPAGIGLAFLGPQIMGLLYSSVAAVEIGGDMLRIYGLTAVFAGLAIPMISMLQAIGKEKISLRNLAIGAALKIVVNFIFVGIPSINIKGAAIGTLVSYLFIFVANLLSLIKYTGVKPNLWKTILKPLISAFACGLSTIFLDLSSMGKFGTIAEIAVAAVVYVAVLIILNTFEEEDVISLPKGEKILKIFKKLRIIR